MSNSKWRYFVVYSAGKTWLCSKEITDCTNPSGVNPICDGFTRFDHANECFRMVIQEKMGAFSFPDVINNPPLPEHSEKGKADWKSTKGIPMFIRVDAYYETTEDAYKSAYKSAQVARSGLLTPGLS